MILFVAPLSMNTFKDLGVIEALQLVLSLLFLSCLAPLFLPVIQDEDMFSFHIRLSHCQLQHPFHASMTVCTSLWFSIPLLIPPSTFIPFMVFLLFTSQLEIHCFSPWQAPDTQGDCHSPWRLSPGQSPCHLAGRYILVSRGVIYLIRNMSITVETNKE